MKVDPSLGNSHNSRIVSTGSEMFPSVLDWSLLLQELESTDFDLLQQYLKKLGLTPTELTDENGFTILHHAVLKGQVGKVDQVLQMVNSMQRPTQKHVKEWIEARTSKD